MKLKYRSLLHGIIVIFTTPTTLVSVSVLLRRDACANTQVVLFIWSQNISSLSFSVGCAAMAMFAGAQDSTTRCCASDLHRHCSTSSKCRIICQYCVMHRKAFAAQNCRIMSQNDRARHQIQAATAATTTASQSEWNHAGAASLSS